MTPSATTLLITLKRRVRRLTLDGAFYGDYRLERHGAESANAAAIALRNVSHSVEIVTSAATP